MRLVILDRDGVINEDSPEFVKSVEEFRPIPGSLAAISKLSQAEFRVVVASNQSGLARGLLDPGHLHDIHAAIAKAVMDGGGHIEAFFFCPHAAEDDCDCRKPKPGLLEAIGRRLRTPLENVPVVGDSLRDLEAARACGARPILVRTGNGRDTEAGTRDWPGLTVCDDLAAVAELLTREQ